MSVGVATVLGLFFGLSGVRLLGLFGFIVSCHRVTLFNHVVLSSTVNKVVSLIGIPWWILVVAVVIRVVAPCGITLLTL